MARLITAMQWLKKWVVSFTIVLSISHTPSLLDYFLHRKPQTSISLPIIQFLSAKFSNALMALSFCSPSSIFLHCKNPRASFSLTHRPFLILASSADDSPRPSLRISTNSNPKARFIARRSESVTVRQLARPLSNVRRGFGLCDELLIACNVCFYGFLILRDCVWMMQMSI